MYLFKTTEFCVNFSTYSAYLICSSNCYKAKLLQVAWVSVDSQTILSIHNSVITRNPRISLSRPSSNQWFLTIQRVQPSDRGWFMCQINTDPMVYRSGYLEVEGDDSRASSNQKLAEQKAWRINIIFSSSDNFGKWRQRRHCHTGGRKPDLVMWGQRTSEATNCVAERGWRGHHG